MQQRSAFVRFLAIGWATFQLASPAITALADGRLAAANASEPSTHVEATSTSSCPQVHSPDCAICRYLSGPISTLPPATIGLIVFRDAQAPRGESALLHTAALVLPPGRGPPALNV